MKLKTQELNIVALVKRYVQSFESLARQKKIEFYFNSSEENIPLFVDKDKIEKILFNLLSNAFKFTEEGGMIEVSVSQSSLEVSTHEVENRVVTIKISDTGHGIPPEYIDHIFDRFYQAEHKDNSYYEGTGIGLALTKELVELHHGTIKVESKPDKGSSFIIFLPLGKEHLEPEEIETDRPNEAKSLAFPAVVKESKEESTTAIETDFEPNNNLPVLLIVEDNNDMRIYIREYFENEYQILEAVDGLDGYEKSIEHIPDIIISDVMMPKIDGNEFCRKIKVDERTSHIPVILLTARASMESRIEGLETGADDFLTKPFDGEELQVRVKNLLEQRQRTRNISRENFKKITPVF